MGEIVMLLKDEGTYAKRLFLIVILRSRLEQSCLRWDDMRDEGSGIDLASLDHFLGLWWGNSECYTTYSINTLPSPIFPLPFFFWTSISTFPKNLSFLFRLVFRVQFSILTSIPFLTALSLFFSILLWLQLINSARTRPVAHSNNMIVRTRTSTYRKLGNIQ